MGIDKNTQTPDNPAFPDVVWARPETAHGAGKLLIVGGGGGDLGHVSALFSHAETAGAGTIRLLLPDSLRKLTKDLPHIEYAPSTPSGSFGQKALTELQDIAHWSDGVLLAGDLGKNSETSLLLEKFITKYPGIMVFDQDAYQSFASGWSKFLNRPSSTVLCLNFDQLRSLAIELGSTIAITNDITIRNFHQALIFISQHTEAVLLTSHNDSQWAVSRGAVCESRTPTSSSGKTAAWAIQQPHKLYEAVVSSLL